MPAEPTLQALHAKVREARALNPSLRNGQAVWNTAVEMWPKLVEPLRGTEYDPFYEDSRLPEFLSMLYTRIQEEL